MKIKKIAYFLILIVLSLILLTIDSEFDLFKTGILKNGFILLIINMILSFILFLIYGFLNRGFTISRKSIIYFFWIILVLGIYFLIGYFLAGNIFSKNNSPIYNFLSFSILTIIGLVFWSIFYFSKVNYSNGWITIKNIEWVIYLAFFSYSLPFEKYVDSKKIKIYFILIPFLPAIIMWLGFEFKSL